MKWEKLIDSYSYGWLFLFLDNQFNPSNEYYMLHIFALISFPLLQSSCYKLYVYFGNFCHTTITQMSALKRNKKNYLWKLWNTNWKKLFLTAYEELFNWDASFFSVSQFLNNFPDLFPFNSLVFSNDRWNLTGIFVDNSQVVLNN